MVLRDGLYRCRRLIKQSNLLIVSEQEMPIRVALVTALHHRRLLEGYIRRDSRFLGALSPIRLLEDSPLVARLAEDAAERADVGPMAAVPGALADLMVASMKLCGAEVRVVENGGEVAACSTRPLKVGIYAGLSKASGRIGFGLSEDDFPLGISTSSATVSHALSFGEADAAVTVADTAALADATSTAVCNAVVGEDVESSVQRGLEAAESMEAVRGALVIRGRFVGRTGKLPKLLSIKGSISDMFEAAQTVSV
jgi:hypothetical protein